MRTIQEIRRLNARKSRDGAGGNIYSANAIDCEPTQTSRFMGDGAAKNIDDVVAKHIEKCFNLPMGWLDQEHQTTNVIKPPSVPDTNGNFIMVPVMSWVQAGTWTKFDYAEVDLDSTENYLCPVPYGPTTYILRVTGNSTTDGHWPDDMILVGSEVPAVYGDDVIALMHDSGKTIFKRLIGDAGQCRLEALSINWSEPYIKINGNCSIIDTVISSEKPRR